MDLKIKRKSEVTKQKEKKKEEVILAALEVLKKKGIENTKMSDISTSAEVGIASLYRYFKTKPELIVSVAIKIWEGVINTFYEDFNKDVYKSQNGIKNVATILEVFLNLYRDHKNFLRFIEEFDNYVIKEKISPADLDIYEKNILNLMPVMIEALEKGKNDKSINLNINNEEFYMTLTHSLMSLCQKLISRNTILNSDKDIEGEAQVKLIIKMAIEYAKN